MLSRLQRQFGTAGLIIAVIALVAALTGGAIAATSNGGGDAITLKAKKGKKAKKAKKGKRGPRGKQGKPGPAGPAGPQGERGPAGPRGAAGADGKNGENGQDGENGNDGESVTSTTEPPGPNCINGGVKYVSADAERYVCNGQNGADGQTGFTDTLPPGKMQTGTWTLNGHESIYGNNLVGISFNIPLASPIAGAGNVHWVGTAANAPAECENPDHPGAASFANPEASPGHFCAWGDLQNVTAPDILDPLNGPGTMTSGTYLFFPTPGAATDTSFGFGSWAVTAS